MRALAGVWGRLVAVLVGGAVGGALGGCNLVFGLTASVDDARDGGGDDAPDAADGDRDNDGVRDSVDLCPTVADPAQHDEDGDGRGDRCDPCPHRAGHDDQDNDEDAVPDACDPHPAMSGGQLRFYGFHGADELIGWSLTGGGVGTDGLTIADDALVLTPATVDGELRALVPGQGDRLVHVEAALVVAAPTDGGLPARGYAAVTHVSATDGFLCQTAITAPGSAASLATYRFAGGVAEPLIAVGLDEGLPLGDQRLTLDVGPGDSAEQPRVNCALAGAATTYQLAEVTTAELAPGGRGLRTVGVPLRVAWLVIVDHP